MIVGVLRQLFGYQKIDFYWFLPLLMGGIAVHCVGLFPALIDDDPALYACIAREMVLRADYFNLYFLDGSDWLDKPHFPFWMIALSFQLLGISAFAYRLPSFLFFLLSLYYTYRLGKKLYTPTVAKMAVLMALTALQTLISSFDVRAEIYLAALFMGALYHLYRVYKEKHRWSIFWAALLTACAIMTKGIFILIPLAGTFFIYFIITKEYLEFLNYRWYLILLLTALFIVPEMYGLYQQFDAHPEKIVFGRTHVSGLQFFFWDSQLGRFFNNGPITRPSGDPFFFVHTQLWSFLPWSPAFFAAIFYCFKNQKFRPKKAQILLYIACALTFLLFSASSFQLPHYLLLLSGPFAIITAVFVEQAVNEKRLFSVLFTLQTLVTLLMLGVFIFLLLYAPTPNYFLIAIGCLGVLLPFLRYKKITIQNFFLRSFLFAFLYGLASFWIYPQIASYQSGNMAAEWLKQQSYTQVAELGHFKYAFNFYSPIPIRHLHNLAQATEYIGKHKEVLFFAKDVEREALKDAGFSIKTVASFEDQPLRLAFFLPNDAPEKKALVNQKHFILVSFQKL